MMSLAWPLFRITEQAALAAWPQTGCGDKNKIDGLAVTAMRQSLNEVAMRGKIVIGEGEIDHAPMLYIGEEVGTGTGPSVDIAVDPIEGTRMVAMGQNNALSVMALAPQGACCMRLTCICANWWLTVRRKGRLTSRYRWKRT